MKLKVFRFISRIACCLALLSGGACSNIDCPLDNIVGMTVNLYSAENRTSLTLTDTLTVRSAGADTLLLNRGYALSTFIIPLRYETGTDTLLFRFPTIRDRLLPIPSSCTKRHATTLRTWTARPLSSTSCAR